MPDRLPTGQSGSVDDLDALVQTHCGRFGGPTCELILDQARRPAGLSRLLRVLGIPKPQDMGASIEALATWLDQNGTRRLFQLVSSQKGSTNYKLKPVPTDTQKHDKRTMSLLLSERKSTARPAMRAAGPSAAPPEIPSAPLVTLKPAGPGRPAVAAPPSGPGQTPAASVPAPPVKATPLPSVVQTVQAGPAYVTLPPGDSRWAELNQIPLYEPPRHRLLAGGGFSGPPGYPFPWPPDLRPGPLDPPPNAPPDALMWPFVERRTGEERRTGTDRRGNVDLIFKNRRFGGGRRKKERRKNWPPR